MRKLWAVPVILMLGCEALNPVVALKEAVKRLDFRLERVEPRLEIAFPLENSALHLGLVLSVNNPSDTRVRALGLGGDLGLEVGSGNHALGKVAFPTGFDLQPRSRGEVRADLRFSYRELQGAWDPLRRAVLQQHAATWHLNGEARIDAFGLPLTVPIRASKGSGQ
jgi:hypothetical protein